MACATQDFKAFTVDIPCDPQGVITHIAFDHVQMANHGAPCHIYANGNPLAEKEFWTFMRAAQGEINALPDNFPALASELTSHGWGKVIYQGRTSLIDYPNYRGSHTLHSGTGNTPAAGLDRISSENLLTVSAKFLRVALKNGCISQADYTRGTEALKTARVFEPA